MTKVAEFIEWLMPICDIAVTQPNDGSGYTVLSIITPTGLEFDVTVTE